MPVNYLRYHPDWKDRIRPDVLKRANYKCQFCGVGNRKEVVRDQSGNWIEVDDVIRAWAKKTGHKIIKIVLTVAHFNHLVIDNRPENLKALCQKCHINHDKDHKAAMQKVKLVYRPEDLIKLSREPKGEQYLPHMFTVLRALGQQVAQIKSIKLKRDRYNGKSSYDQEINREIIRLDESHENLLERCCEILSDHYNYPDPRRFYEKFRESHIKMIGTKARSYVKK